MRILSQQSYNYPENLSANWASESFMPIHDLKLRIKLADNHIVDAALFTLVIGGKVERHACISTQVGCKYGCKFCASGNKIFVRNLSDSELLEEINLIKNAAKIKEIDYLLFMGIGEPLDNLKNLVTCIRSLVRENYKYASRIALATNGLPSQLKSLADAKLPLDMVWISLNASSDKKRRLMMPVANKFSLKQIIKSAKTFSQKSRNFVWLNYLLYKNFNDTAVDSKGLLKILKGNEKYFGLIITSPNRSFRRYKPASYKDLFVFEKKLLDAGVINKIVRFVTAGKNINAGCGEFIFTPYK